MAAITASNVVVRRARQCWDAAGAQFEVQADLAITLAGQGATIGDIPKAVLYPGGGFARITHVDGGFLNNAGTWTFNPATTDYSVGTGDTGANGTGTELIPIDTTTKARANLTGVWYVRVYGIL